jgi:hypothetical protein
VSPGLWACLRRAPTCASELGVLYALPQLAPHVQLWWSKQSRSSPQADPRRSARRVVRRSTNVARRGGLITGSSFYVGMVPAMAMIYCEQLVVVLRVAAVYGRDPMDPIRAAELLVVQGRYATVEEAAAALERVRWARGTSATGPDTALRVVQQLPSMIGLRLRRLNWRSPLDVLIVGAEVASYLVPVISLPVWAYASARAMRRVGRSAIAFYGEAEERRPTTPVVLLPRPRPRSRRIFIASVIPFAVALGVLFSLLPGFHPAVRWIGLVVGEVALLLTFARLVRLTRAVAPASV